MKKILFLILLTLYIPNPTNADVVFTVVADTNTPAPGGNNGGNFLSLTEPVIDDGQIAFRGQDSNSNGFFVSDNGELTRVVDSSTLVPGEDFTFVNFSGVFQQASISNGQIAFVSGGVSGGVFVVNGNNQISSLVRTQDDVPGPNNSTFAGFNNQHIENGTTIFRGGFGAFTGGIYASDGLSVTTVIDSLDNRPIPGVNDDFFSFTPRGIENQSVLFVGGGFNTTTGIYRSTLSGSISVVVDINTPIPEGTGNFTFFDSRFPNVDMGQVVFLGTGPNGQSGIYLVDGNGITKVADRNTLQPGSTNPFTDLREPIIEDGRVFFQGNGSEGLAIYKFEEGEITRLFGTGDTVNGRTITAIFQNVLDVEDNSVVFAARLNSQSAIVKADIVSPGDLNCDGEVDLLDVNPFIDAIANAVFVENADLNQDGFVNLLDVEPFIALLSDGN